MFSMMSKQPCGLCAQLSPSWLSLGGKARIRRNKNRTLLQTQSTFRFSSSDLLGSGPSRGLVKFVDDATCRPHSAASTNIPKPRLEPITEKRPSECLINSVPGAASDETSNRLWEGSLCYLRNYLFLLILSSTKMPIFCMCGR